MGAEYANDVRMAATATGERYIDTVMLFLAWCDKRPQQWLGPVATIQP
jgi:hypothetical protein